MEINGLTIPGHLAERSRLILRYGDPSLLAVYGQIEEVAKYFKSLDSYFSEAQMQDEIGFLSLGAFRLRRKLVGWVQFGEFRSWELT